MTIKNLKVKVSWSKPLLDNPPSIKQIRKRLYKPSSRTTNITFRRKLILKSPSNDNSNEVLLTPNDNSSDDLTMGFTKLKM